MPGDAWFQQRAMMLESEKSVVERQRLRLILLVQCEGRFRDLDPTLACICTLLVSLVAARGLGSSE